MTWGTPPAPPRSRRWWRSFERPRYHHPTSLEVEVVVAHVSEVVEQSYLRHLERSARFTATPPIRSILKSRGLIGGSICDRRSLRVVE